MRINKILLKFYFVEFYCIIFELIATIAIRFDAMGRREEHQNSPLEERWRRQIQEVITTMEVQRNLLALERDFIRRLLEQLTERDEDNDSERDTLSVTSSDISDISVAITDSGREEEPNDRFIEIQCLCCKNRAKKAKLDL